MTGQQKEIIKIGLDSAARLNRLIDALLDITKIEAGVTPMDIGQTDLGAMLDETAREYSLVAAGKMITLSKNRPEAPVRTYCDKEKIRSVLVNLVSNALKFTPGGGRIILSVGVSESDALLTVENSGPGIDQEDLPKLFNKFARLGCKSPSAVKGTGLGLAISKGIVEMHRGAIWAESQPEKGCKFHVRLPLLDFDAAAGEMVRREIQRSGAGKRRFSAVTLVLPKKTRKAWTEAASKAEDFLKAHIRSFRILLKKDEGNITMLVPDADPARGCKLCSFIERGMSQLGIPEPGTGHELTFLLSYPDDFVDERSFAERLAEPREKMHA